MQQDQFQSPDGPNAAPGSVQRRHNVLVVEDDRHTADALRALLGQEGFDTTVYYNGADALRNLNGKRYDAVLIDVHLPDMNGLVLSQQLRSTLGTGVPIVVVSGDTSMETLNSLSHVGATYFLAKPVSPQLLLEQLRAHVSGQFKTTDCD